MVLLLVVAAGLIFWQHPLWVNDQVTRFHLWRSGVKSKYIDVGAYRLHYFEATPPDGKQGTPLLLVHGLGARGEDWGSLIPGLAAAGFHVYVPDLVGYGRSPQPDVSYSISMEEDTVVQFMRAVGVKQANVGGWSMGGWIAMKLTLDHPELVNRLVVYDSAGVYYPGADKADAFTPTDAAGLRQLLAMLFTRPPSMPDFAARDGVRKIGDNAWVIRRSLTEMMAGRDLLDFRLHLIDRPTLVVWGSRDDLIPLDAGKRIHEKIPGSVLNVVEGCGHMAPMECWQPVLQSTVEFLKAEPPMQGGEKTVPGPP